MNNTDQLLLSPSDLSAKRIFSYFKKAVQKKFGQNFIFDEKINSKIVSTAGDIAEKVVAEIGPGPGGLTLEILKRNVKKLYLIELDSHWSDVWRKLSDLFPGKLEVIEKDALGFDMATIPIDIIISNLPYNISAQLLIKWIQVPNLCSEMILMFQKEVADRLYASPSTKAYGRLSVLVQWIASVTKIFDLEPGSFFPSPKVKSTLLKIIPFNYNYKMDDFYFFSHFLTYMFQHRRKSVFKPLSKFVERPEELLVSLGYNRNTRAEEICVDHYVKILSFVKNAVL
ncbi:MAG: 16S rRNA (adenine(1518)-N(6)/adenine(1519)-N(6))-dimethyltransferase RsmA [Holosporaceae bacterium]|jgi:16S rRNA (adenine1518-N6/adenine1519-N6)-dimethyltransferase|nr:16S rRNA (adenine(1518)-N(6)/adenine(1519)-N(6))-dimethyltransferase RsmA [Holosporaceae bacterium]